jgi:ATP-dependent Clp protease ATP-binding subunit ClpA
MAATSVSLDALIASVRAEAPDEPLAQLEAAARLRAEVAELTDALLGHFVDQARRAGCSWSQIGDALGVSKQAAQQRHNARAVPAERLTDRTRLALERGLDAAQQAGAAEAEPVHVLLGLLAVPECLAAKLLVEHGCTAGRVAAELGGGPAPGAAPAARLPGYTATAARALTGALEQALRLGHNYIGTEHVLLALAAEPDGAVGPWLAAAGASEAALRARVQEVLGSLAG